MGADDDPQPQGHQSEEGQSVTSKYAIAESTSAGMDFFSSVIAGLLLGLGADWVFNTAPVFVIIGIIAGFISGFAKLWSTSRSLEAQARARGRIE
jgi:F0F1-type ATP synthase assembly protein I